MNPDLEKKWTKSRGMVANFLGMLFPVLAFLGMTVAPELRENIEVTVTLGAMFVTSAVGLWGRLKAGAAIKSFFGMKGPGG